MKICHFPKGLQLNTYWCMFICHHSLLCMRQGRQHRRKAKNQEKIWRISMKHMLIYHTEERLIAFIHGYDFPKHIVYSENKVQRITWIDKFNIFSMEVLCNCKH